MKGGIKREILAEAAALALLSLISLSVAENLGLPLSVAPNQTQASQVHYHQNAPFNVTLFANATAGDLLWCNATITLNGAGINFTTLAGTSNTTYIGNISNQSVANTSWEIIAPGRGSHNLNFSLVCNGSVQSANTTAYVDLLNITLVNATTPYSIRWNDSYLEVYRNASYNVSITVSTLDSTQSLTNVITYLDSTGSAAFSLNASSPSQTSMLQAGTPNAPVNTVYSYQITANDTQNDSWTQPLIIRIISPLNVTLSFNDSAIAANQSFTATATARNLGTVNLTNVNLTFTQGDGGLILTNTTCQLFNLTPSSQNTCAWTFNTTSPNAKANLTISATSSEGDNNLLNFSTRVYGWGSFTANASVFFGTYNHTAGTVTQSVILDASASSDDLANFNCTSGENLSATCQSLTRLTKGSTTPFNITLAIPQYTSKGMHYGNVSVYAENANPQNVSYSLNITGIKKCSGTTSGSATRATGATSTGFATGLNITNTGNVNVNVSCVGGTCGTMQPESGKWSLAPGESRMYNLSVSQPLLSATSTTATISCASTDTNVIDDGSNYTLAITHPSGESSNSNNQNTNTNTQTTQQVTQQNTTTYAYTVALLPTTTTLKKGESVEFTIEVKNTGTLGLSNVTISGDSTLQFSVSPTKITSIPKGQSGYSKITVTTTNSTAAGTYKVTAKACRTATSCVTSAESTITIAEEAQPVLATEAEPVETNVTEEPQQNTALNVTTIGDAISLRIENATNTENITTYLEVLNASGIVVYNITTYVQPLDGNANYNLSLPQKLKAGNYTLRVALKDLAGNTIVERTMAYSAKAIDPPPTTKTTTALTALTPNLVNGLLVVIMVLFIIAGIKTSRIGIGGIKDRLNLKQKILDKAQTAYQQGEYGKAKEYKASAERVSKAELDLMQKIADSEKRILQMYREGKHLQARKEQESLARMKKELELLRERHQN